MGGDDSVPEWWDGKNKKKAKERKYVLEIIGLAKGASPTAKKDDPSWWHDGDHEPPVSEGSVENIRAVSAGGDGASAMAAAASNVASATSVASGTLTSPNRRPRSSRNSLSSKSLVRNGLERPNHLSGLISRERLSVVTLGADESATAVEAVATSPSGGRVQVVVDTHRDPRSEAKLQRVARRLSAIADDLSQKDDTSNVKRRVEVRLRDVSYGVPLRVGGPGIATVCNRSVCYVTYEFFRRLHLFCQREKRMQAKKKLEARMSRMHLPGAAPKDDSAGDGGEWIPESETDVFVPYRKVDTLKKINLVLRAGRSYLILGPPGCGKTTLLKAIAGALPDKRNFKGEPTRAKPHLSGRVEYNGLTSKDDPQLVVPNIVSYVEQHDHHAPYLTVRETFDFAFQCRNPDESGAPAPSDRGTTKATRRRQSQKAHAITENLTMEGLGIGHAADTFVGGADVRGVSGGQRRRVTVGEMMQARTPVACADEISTGLDAATTYDIVKSMVYFARATKTTRIISLLQPGPETFSLFDEVIILSEGHVIFAGPIEEVVDYFADLGYELPPSMDVADFLQSLSTPDGDMFLAGGEGPSTSSTSKEERNEDSGEEGGVVVTSSEQQQPLNQTRRHLTAAQFAEAFRTSEMGESIVKQLNECHPYEWELHGSGRKSQSDEEEASSPPRSCKASKIPEDFKQQYQNNVFRSTWLNLNRFITLWKRNKGFIIGKMAENVGMAAAVGGILFQQARAEVNVNGTSEEDAKATDKVVSAVYSSLFMATFHILLGTMTSASEELEDRIIHYKHSDANFYQSLSFAIGRLVSTFPQRLLEIVSFGTPVYWLVGLAANAGAFFTFLAVLVCLVIALKVLFGILAMILPNKSLVLGFGIFIFLLLSQFGGFIVFPDAIPNYYQWIYWANPVAWSYQALLSNEFMTSKYDNLTPWGTRTGDELLSVRGFQVGREWIGYAFAFLLPYTVLCTIILSLVLQYVRVTGSTRKQSRKKYTVDEDSKAVGLSLPFTPVDLTFENMSYEVQASTGKETLRLLNNISGAFMSGRMCALMGSSGAGKTTLMDVIAMRKQSGTTTGDILLNGLPQERVAFLRSSGYVEQFDVQAPELTVRETVAFSARLRLGNTYPETRDDSGKMQFVDSVLDMLELTTLQDKQVGSIEDGSGLTFEQRKRLGIAAELAGSPSVLFLDEPTSGLDSRAALLVMRLLKRIADTGRTICATIHQPSAAVFQMFDDLLLLRTGGEVVFFGDLGPDSVYLTDYFESHGATPIEYGENPASWMLRASASPEAYLNSKQYESLMDQIQSVVDNATEEKQLSYETVFATTRKERIWQMIKRINTIYRRSPAYNLTRLVVSVLYAFIMGSAFLFHAYKDNLWTQNEVDGILATIFLSLIVIGLTCIHMVLPVMKMIRDVFYKHRASGMLEYISLSSALEIGEAPYICLISVLFSVIFYVTVGIFHQVNQFFYFWGFFTFNVAIYSYFGQAFISVVKDIPTAGALCGALIGFNIFFSGFIVRPQNFNAMGLFGYYFSPGHYAYEGIVASQFDGVTLPVQATNFSPFFYHLGCTGLDVDSCTGTMDEYVEFSFGGMFTKENFGLDVGVLAAYLVLARGLTYFGLKKFNYVNT